MNRPESMRLTFYVILLINFKTNCHPSNVRDLTKNRSERTQKKALIELDWISRTCTNIANRKPFAMKRNVERERDVHKKRQSNVEIDVVKYWRLYWISRWICIHQLWFVQNSLHHKRDFCNENAPITRLVSLFYHIFYIKHIIEIYRRTDSGRERESEWVRTRAKARATAHLAIAFDLHVVTMQWSVENLI